MPKIHTESVVEIPFRLDSISPIADPQGGEAIWHRYVITQGENTITGLRPGSRTEVGLQVEQMIERLNERFGKKQAKLNR